MSIYDTFSSRTRRIAGMGNAEVYRYDDLPPQFRNQVLHIWDTAIGIYHAPSRYGGDTIPASNDVWQYIEKTAAREFGLKHLGKSAAHNPKDRCVAHLENCSVEEALDLIELSFRVIDRDIRRLDELQKQGSGMLQTPDAAIEELNHRFQLHALGYRFENGSLLRVDSELIHTEVVKPILRLLASPAFAGAEAEFFKAHEHYRAGRAEETLAECLKAFESTMKVICEQRQWEYAPTATAKDLIAVVFENGLIPDYLLSEFTGLRSILESGVPTMRNRSAGHGQGSTIRTVPSYLASYCLHLTAANMLLLAEAHSAHP